MQQKPDLQNNFELNMLEIWLQYSMWIKWRKVQ